MSDKMKHEDKISKARILVEAMPYIEKFRGKTVVIKFGGSLMVNDALKKQFALDVVLLRYVGINPIIVHGGGKEISRWMKKVGKDAVFVDGLRYTDDETMELTEMVLSGKVNNEIVSLINQSGGQAVGISGKSANLFSAERIRSKKEQDLGRVGTIVDVDQRLLDSLCQEGYIPVVSSIGADENGDALNLNADNVAASLAHYINAFKLFLLTDVDGLIIDGEFQNRFDLDQAKAFLTHPDVKDGMVPKLEYSITALNHGVDHVHILNGMVEHAILLEMFTDEGIGTMIYRETQ